MKKKILIAFGTRPEAIKMAPVIEEFSKYSDKIELVVCVSGQHREMLDQVLEIFNIKPNIDLNIMRPGQDLTDITVRVLTAMREVLDRNKPDLVLVHGDTTTSAATALAAFYKQIPIGHIEAGLRTYNLYHPWPEEINRQITDRLASMHFAPTQLNRQNLINEGIEKERIYVTGNTVIDAVLMARSKIDSSEKLKNKIETELGKLGLPVHILKQWNGAVGYRRMILITGHRRENFGSSFINICEAIRDLSDLNKNVDFVYPMHPNPQVREPINNILGGVNKESDNNVYLIEPLKYLQFIYLMQKSYFVLTDSGGIQEEAPGLGKPVLVMRDTTERPEGVTAGTVKLIGTNKTEIIKEVNDLLFSTLSYKRMSKAINPYGDGRASERIVRYCI